ncbi:MAG: 3-deoxy-manno-octulosonate cytidylyltransferase [Steroidobacteraceae bacterium]
MYRVVIPARYGSTRLPGKVLIEVAGRTILEWVHARARASGAREVIIATDDARVADAARGFGADVAMTSVSHPSGTDRIAEVARARNWSPEDLVVNVQGDEPLMPPTLIDQVAELLASDKDADIATLSAPLGAPAELTDPNVVKIVCDRAGHALYFSRAPIPWNRDAGHDAGPAHRHVGIYAYRVRSLRLMTELPPSPLETIEKLEQLRALENGLMIRVGQAREQPGADINTREDLERVERVLGASSRG